MDEDECKDHVYPETGDAEDTVDELYSRYELSKKFGGWVTGDEVAAADDGDKNQGRMYYNSVAM